MKSQLVTVTALETNGIGLTLVADANGNPLMRWNNKFTTEGEWLPAGPSTEYNIRRAVRSELRMWMDATDEWMAASDNDSLRARGDCRWQAATAFNRAVVRELGKLREAARRFKR
jgi:hypothetical protein